MRFMLLMIPNGYEVAAPDRMPSAEDVAAMMKFNEELQKAGVLLALEGLHPPASAVRVTFTGSQRTRTDGPFAGTSESVGGFWIIKVASKEAAVEWAMRCPVFHDAVIEVRQVQEMEEFPADVQEAAKGFREMQEGKQA